MRNISIISFFSIPSPAGLLYQEGAGYLCDGYNAEALCPEYQILHDAAAKQESFLYQEAEKLGVRGSSPYGCCRGPGGQTDTDDHLQAEIRGEDSRTSISDVCW